MAAVTIPVMAKCRIGHFAEAQILEALGVDFIDESEGKKTHNLQKQLLKIIYESRLCTYRYETISDDNMTITQMDIMQYWRVLCVRY